jgi:hypothetical protein
VLVFRVAPGSGRASPGSRLPVRAVPRAPPTHAGRGGLSACRRLAVTLVTFDSAEFLALPRRAGGRQRRRARSWWSTTPRATTAWRSRDGIRGQPVIANTANVGFAAGQNQAIAASAGSGC